MIKQKFNQAGDVIQHSKLGKSCWLVMGTCMTGGSTGGGMNRHDDYPNGHQLILRRMKNSLFMNIVGNLDWTKEGEKRFYQSGCFIDEVMLPYIKPTHTFGGK